MDVHTLVTAKLKRLRQASVRALASVCVAMALVGVTQSAGIAGTSNATVDKPNTHRRLRPAPLKLPPDIKLPSYKPGAMPFTPGETLVFLARWIGIPVATAEFRLRPDPGRDSLWTEEATVRTNGLADLLYPMRDYMREKISRASFAPQRAYIRQDEKHRVKEFLVSFDRHEQMATAVEHYRGRTQVRRFAGKPFGPLSAITMALSQPLKVGDKLTFDVLSGRYRFVFSFLVDRRGRISTPLGNFDAFRMVPSVDYVSEGDLRGSARSAVVWVSADEPHLPLRIESAVFIGQVRADLVRIEPPASTRTPRPAARGSQR